MPATLPNSRDAPPAVQDTLARDTCAHALEESTSHCTRLAMLTHGPRSPSSTLHDTRRPQRSLPSANQAPFEVSLTRKYQPGSRPATGYSAMTSASDFLATGRL